MYPASDAAQTTQTRNTQSSLVTQTRNTQSSLITQTGNTQSSLITQTTQTKNTQSSLITQTKNTRTPPLQTSPVRYFFIFQDYWTDLSPPKLAERLSAGVMFGLSGTVLLLSSLPLRDSACHHLLWCPDYSCSLAKLVNLSPTAAST